MRRFTTAVFTATLAVSAVVAGTAHAATGDRLRLTFESDALGLGTTVNDSSGHGNDGTVRGEDGGRIVGVAGLLGSTAANFVASCSIEPCPKVLVQVPSSAELNPGYASFEYGVRLRLAPWQTSDGQNLLQKGRWSTPGGQWKLQVDNSAGRPSCRVAGELDGVDYSEKVVSEVSVADDEWHTVTCRRTQTELKILVDGVNRGETRMPAVRLSSEAPVTVGAKGLGDNNDQFQGVLDDVFMRLL
jgi:hypothetical protein